MVAKRHGSAGWGPCLIVLAAAVVIWLAALTGSAKGKEARSRKITPQILDALARQYRDAGLPLPPADAAPTLLQVGRDDAGGVVWSVGFRVGPGETEELPGRFLVGTETGEPYVVDSNVPAARPLDRAKGLPPTVKLYGGWTYQPDPFPVNHWLALAIQCHLRGDDRLAGQILERGLTRDATAGHRLTPLGDGGLRDSLAATAWNHWMNALLLPNTDRGELLAHLEKLSAEFSVLNGPFQRDYLAALRLTLVPSTSAPDSAEALVDGLIEHNAVENPGDEQLKMLGFAAVPALIAHLDDRRLTRGVTGWRHNDGTSDPERVCEVVGDLIQAIAGNTGELVSTSPDASAGQRIDRAAVLRWWTWVSAMGEEAYMTREAFPPSDVGLQIVSARYPQRLGEIYARLLKEQPDTGAAAVAEAISACLQLGREERVRLLRLGITSPKLERFYEAQNVLLTLDRAEGEAALIEKLDAWPTDVQTTYNGQPPETLASDFMIYSDSAEVWRAYERALFRARPALRMELLSRLAGFQPGPPRDVRQLALLDLFLDDPEVRVIRKEDEASGGKFEGYPVTAANRKMSVGNFVAELLGKLLKVKPPPGPTHTERWWAKYREAVRAAIEEHERDALLIPIEIE